MLSADERRFDDIGGMAGGDDDDAVADGAGEGACKVISSLILEDTHTPTPTIITSSVRACVCAFFLLFAAKQGVSRLLEHTDVPVQAVSSARGQRDRSVRNIAERWRWFPVGGLHFGHS